MTGSLTISIEIELGWGVHDLPYKNHLSNDGVEERAYLRRLLRKTEACDVPVSFDVVGHLLLNECEGSHGGPYRDGWFDADPGTDVETDPLFYAPDVARRVLASGAGHELCTHTFSHLLCDEASEELVELELRRVKDLHEAASKSMSIPNSPTSTPNRPASTASGSVPVASDSPTVASKPVSSFVPPRHFQPRNETLRRNGIRAARYAKTRYSPTRAHRFKEITVGPHPEWAPRVRDGVLETYCTTYPSLTARSLPAGQRDPSAPFKAVPIAARKRAHEYYLRRSTRRAIESGTPLHLWCHLYDLSNEHQWQLLSDYLEYLSSIPEEDLTIRTMEELADELGPGSPTR